MNYVKQKSSDSMSRIEYIKLKSFFNTTAQKKAGIVIFYVNCDMSN